MNDKISNFEFVHYIIEKLSDKSTDKIQFLGIFCEIIYSKEMFKRNKFVSEFLRKSLGLYLPDYVVKSRTLMTARAIKFIYLLSDLEIERAHKTTIETLNGYMNGHSNKVPVKENSKKKRDENDKLKGWLNGL
ncbi:MAG TPA: hypothetical protein DCX82_15820 [Lachnospiraceae bacterium]|nr:hypothetical protein [Lachnospiraceae bacterium]